MDWIALILSAIGIFFNAKKKIWCWPIWIASNVFWGLFSISTGQLPLLILQIVFLLMNFYGWYCWRKK